MFITVTCPKCGRTIKAKKKFVLATGGVPCLKCKVRIPVPRDHVEAQAEPESTELEAAAVPTPVAEPESPPAIPEPAAAAGPDNPPPPPTPELSEPAPPAPVPAPDHNDDDAIVVKPAIANPLSELISATQEIGTTLTGPQIAFTCPQCQTTYPLRKALAGKKIRCKGCTRIVKVAPESPVIPGTDPDAPTEPQEDIPVVFSPSETPPPPPPRGPDPAPAPEPAVAQPGKKSTSQLRTALTGAEERATTAEEMIQQLVRDKASSELSAARKIRELDGQIRELTARLKSREAEAQQSGGMSRAEVEALLKTLCEALDANLAQEIAAHRNLVDDLKKQLTQALLPS